MTGARFRDLRTTDELVTLYRFPSRDAVRMWIHRHQVPVYRRGRTILVDTRDIDARMRSLAKRRGDAVPDLHLTEQGANR